MTKSNLEEVLAFHMQVVGLPDPVREFKFHPKRQWRADFAWPEYKVIVEVQGGIWMKPTSRGHGKGHAHPKRIRQDCEKSNEAQIMGWLVVKLVDSHIGTMMSGGKAIDYVTRALKARGWQP